MSVHAALDAIHQALARSPLAVRAAAKLRNQCRQVIGYAVTFRCGGADAERNGEARLARFLAPRVRTFVDVGANVGDWAALLLAGMPPGGQGLLFEPSGSALARLTPRFADVAGVEVVACAVGDRAGGEVTFYEEPGAGQTSSLVGSPLATAVARQVAVSTLDVELGRRGWAQVDVLKIDTEGYDLHVLRGAAGLLRERRVGLVQFEYNGAWLPAGSALLEAFALLSACGYEIWLLTPGGLEPFDYRLYGDFYSYANFVAVPADRRAEIAALLL